MPDLMADMLKAKIAHPLAGANTAWVPSPTAATLHALHYHGSMLPRSKRNSHNVREPLSMKFSPAAGRRTAWSPADIEEELNNNCAEHLGIRGSLDRLGRWLLQSSRLLRCGSDGGSRDLAHLQPACRELAAHGFVRRSSCGRSKKMARVVDQQNAGDPGYHRLEDDPEYNVRLTPPAI